jgi:hypothetical protein
VRRGEVTTWLVCAVLAAWCGGAVAQSPSQNYKGLEVAVVSATRATNVSLTDCPAGANTVRGVIRPGDANEFASVTLDFKVQPAFKPSALPKPVLHDTAGKLYNTAQSFGDIGSVPAFTCTFSFRVPKGTSLQRLTIDTVSLDLSKLPPQ